MPILGVIASSTRQGQSTDAGAMFSIGTVLVGSSGASSISFTSIPSTYKHLQLRIISRDGRAATLNNWHLRLNSDTTNSYTYHTMYGNAASLQADGSASPVDKTDYYYEPSTSSTASVFASSVIDILDYSSSNKYKTIRFLGGYDDNGNGRLSLTSNLWINTNAVTGVSFTCSGGASFIQYSSFALYGIK